MPRCSVVWLLGLIALGMLTTGVSAQSPPVFPTSLSLPDSLIQDFSMQTLGGRQFWGDVQFFQDYRIQRNVFTGHYRLLDGSDWRHASGTLEHCRAELDRIRQTKSLPPMQGKGVILLHGISRSSKSMASLGDALREAGYSVFLFDYPSLQVSIPNAADSLHQAISQLDGITELSIVGHSMGGLVTRAYFDQHRDPRIRRVVMLGTPNQGADLADLLKSSIIARTLAGPAGRQLVSDTNGLIATLPAPPVEFGIIAGARGKSNGWNPLIPGDDDGTVTVRSTRLAGASDFMTAPVLHHGLLSSAEVAEGVVRFLEAGRFSTDTPPQPIDATNVFDVPMVRNTIESSAP